MSLDVYLTFPNDEREFVPGRARIFIRENGSTREITREEWDERFSGTEPVVLSQHDEGDNRVVYRSNITHNLNTMAKEAGIYEHLWRPDEIGITKASQLIEPLSEGLSLLRSDSLRFKAFDPPNKWGDYDSLVRFVTEYLDACREYPDATVETCR
jgi:hypothetical protein